MRKISAKIFVPMVLLAYLSITHQGYAQTVSGSIAGRVIDQQGAVVSAATVTATEPNKNVTVTTKTNEQGDFGFAGLQPGNYSIRVEAAGFKSLERPKIPVDSNDKLALGDLVL